MKRIFFLNFIAVILLFSPLAAKAASQNSGTFNFRFGDKTFPVSAEDFNSWKKNVSLPKFNYVTRPVLEAQTLTENFLQNKQPNNAGFQTFRFSPGLIYAYIKNLSSQINATTTEPELLIENNSVIKFTPPQDGLKTNIYQTLGAVLKALQNNESSIEIIAATATPSTQLSQLNNLGINELIARGESNFKGSPNNRRHNIAVGLGKFKGVILAPNQEFSFNKFLGPVEKEQGFLPELVIKKDGTVPELGGGLCQVSSTTFRAAMQAGLPITQRKNHAYAVQYYSPQGTDATIYPGVVDLKFINDTLGHILIWPYLKDQNTLVFDFYGTKDGRKVTLEKPVQWDRAADGSMKASWTREVFKNGTTTTDTFKSVYQSPALFHKTESFVTATGTQQNSSPVSSSLPAQAATQSQ